MGARQGEQNIRNGGVQRTQRERGSERESVWREKSVNTVNGRCSFQAWMVYSCVYQGDLA